MENNGKHGHDGPSVKVNYIIPEGIRSLFANHVVVQNSGQGEFHLSFFEVEHPIMLGSTEEQLDARQSLKSVDAKCVAKIVLTKDRIEGVIGALVKNYSRTIENVIDAETVSNDKGKKHAAG